uniref:VTT domain-containing protein n=1 Tax=Rhodosorus marinus TaxID=101924 RepID=A0A7S0G2I2_9RHOD
MGVNFGDWKGENRSRRSDEVEKRSIRRWTSTQRTAVSFLLVTIAGMVLSAKLMSSSVWSSRILNCADDFGVARTASLLFTLNFVASSIPIGSTSNFVTLTGLILGPYYGFWVAFLAKFSAAMVIFAFGRTFLRDFVRRQLRGYPTSEKILIAAEMEGWPALIALRLSPVPTVLVNYVMSLADVNLGVYFFSTAAGMVPFLLRAILFGAAARRATDPNIDFKVTMVWLAVAVFVTVVLGRVASRAKAMIESVEPPAE